MQKSSWSRPVVAGTPLLPALASLLTALTPGCQRYEQNGSELAYSFQDSFVSDIGGRAATLFQAISRNQGTVRIAVLLKTPGADAAEDAAKLAWLNGQLTRAVQKWNEPLVGFDGWPWDALRVEFAPASTVRAECQQRGPEDWACASSDTLKVIIDKDSSQVAFAQFVGSLMYLGNVWNKIRPTDANDVKNYTNHVVIHEYGHQFGLGDTYRTRGPSYSEPKYQPGSVMGGNPEFGFPDELQDDDRVAIRSAWQFYQRGGPMTCAPGYVVGEVDSNAKNFHYCRPADATTQRETSPGGGESGTGGTDGGGSTTAADGSIAFPPGASRSGATAASGVNRDGRFYPYCPNGAGDDSDGDFWGWSDGASCVVKGSPQDFSYPVKI